LRGLVKDVQPDLSRVVREKHSSCKYCPCSVLVNFSGRFVVSAVSWLENTVVVARCVACFDNGPHDRLRYTIQLMSNGIIDRKKLLYNRCIIR